MKHDHSESNRVNQAAAGYSSQKLATEKDGYPPEDTRNADDVVVLSS